MSASNIHSGRLLCPSYAHAYERVNNLNDINPHSSEHAIIPGHESEEESSRRGFSQTGIEKGSAGTHGEDQSGGETRHRHERRQSTLGEDQEENFGILMRGQDDETSSLEQGMLANALGCEVITVKTLTMLAGVAILLPLFLFTYGAMGQCGVVPKYSAKVISCEYHWFRLTGTDAVLQIGNKQYHIWDQGNQCRDIPLVEGQIIDGVQIDVRFLIPTKTPQFKDYPFELVYLKGEWKVK